MMVVHRWLTLLVRFGREARCCSRLCSIRGCELLGEKCSVVLHPADQRRAASPLPGEAEKVETWNLGHSATVSQSSVRVNDGKVDPGEVGAIARRPDDGVHLELAFILEAHGPA